MDIDVFQRPDLDTVFRVLRTALRPSGLLEPRERVAYVCLVVDRQAPPALRVDVREGPIGQAGPFTCGQLRHETTIPAIADAAVRGDPSPRTLRHHPSVFGICDKMGPVRGSADPDEFRAREPSPPHRQVRRKPCETTDRRSPT